MFCASSSLHDTVWFAELEHARDRLGHDVATSVHVVLCLTACAAVHVCVTRDVRACATAVVGWGFACVDMVTPPMPRSALVLLGCLLIT